MISYIVILLLICIIGLVYSKEGFQPAPFVSFDYLYDTSLYRDVYDLKIGPDGIPGEKGKNATGRKYLNYVSELAHRTTTTKPPKTKTITVNLIIRYYYEDSHYYYEGSRYYYEDPHYYYEGAL